MLQAFDLSISPDPKAGILFQGVRLSVNAGEKVAIVGPNGAGKSLLLQILSRRLRPDSGRVVYLEGIHAAFLPQDFDLDFKGTLQELLEKVSPSAPAFAIAKAMNRLGIEPVRLQQAFQTLSLGERMRGVLAALLAEEPDILILDEPTNHLDVDAKEWLEQFLSKCPEAVIFACHDRAVINEVADRILELERGSLHEFTGNYDDMVQMKSQKNAKQMSEWESHKSEDRRLRIATEALLQQATKVTKKPTGRTYDPKAKAFYSGMQAKIDRRAKAVRSRVLKGREAAPDKPFLADALALKFPCRPLRSSPVLTVRGLKKSFNGIELFSNLNFSLEKGSRVAIIGPNGSGKTTLFRILLDEMPSEMGEVAWSSDAKVAKLSQARDLLDRSKSAVKALKPQSAEEELFARTALARLGLRGDDVERPIGVLSVGERTKVEVVSMILGGANVLVLDEPTNHLDIASVEALENALVEFPGAILFTSHDRQFVERIATEVINLQ